MPKTFEERRGELHHRVYLIYMLLALVFVISGGAIALEWPVVTLNYDAQSSTYTYHVSVGPNPPPPNEPNKPFGQLLIYTEAIDWDGFTTIWTFGGPVGWTGSSSMGDVGDTAEWSKTSGPDIFASWEGDFTLIAPGTTPVAGQGMTKDGVDDSLHYFDIEVPGVVPEPSSILTLAGLVGLAASAARRRISRR